MPLNDGLVPAEPVYTITLTPTGAMVNGELVRADEGQDDQVAALAEVIRRAARRGRPVRVTAHDSSHTVSLIVGPDGSVEEVATPHASSAPVLPPAPVPFGSRPPLPTPPLPTPPLPVPPTPTTDTPPGLHRRRADSDSPGQDILPAPHGEHARQMHAAVDREDFTQAIVSAGHLESGLTKVFGRDHPWVVNAITFRAWLLLQHGAPWRLAVEVAVEATVRRCRTEAAPWEDTVRVAHNAYAAWCRLAESDHGAARVLADQVLEGLKLVKAGDAAADLRGRVQRLSEGGA